jgi:hypothetical protein
LMRAWEPIKGSCSTLVRHDETAELMRGVPLISRISPLSETV